MAQISPEPLQIAFEENRRFLWNLAYRLTGNAADADDVVQETFLRAMKNPPADTERSLRPWLTQVAMNYGKDLLRRRRRSGYPGMWLPSPVPSEQLVVEPSDESNHPERRYDLMESASFAFLLALEVLSPLQRAVLVLRDVFDYSARDVAEVLELSDAHVRKLHSRARAALAGYDANRLPLNSIRRMESNLLLRRFLDCVASGDVAAVESLLAADVRALSDGGGEFVTIMVPVLGPRNVAALFVGLARKLAAPTVIVEIEVNGLPAIAVHREVPEGNAARYVLQVEANAEGRLDRIYVVLSSRKLTAMPPPASAE